ncbi:DUF7312 domain-containing protein [Candidatus Halobonum tyrrellensis]|uniref:DUF7312 domain-containing protein n=1 Tax=Candidatus Halobonum tyrrellensis G22 TaxID=1324957 RepID=V4GTB7_9EURY|nr:hypothetical protein [Candidatus Halobonum tyrrellensis]ESP88321.1 hypothetical protein K933_09367 [Candidatus Halobonum tyrrellensis G22]
MSDRSDADRVTADDDGRDDEWRFGLDDVDENGVVGPEPTPIEPESVSTENALFVVLGALGTLAVLLSATL